MTPTKCAACGATCELADETCRGVVMPQLANEYRVAAHSECSGHYCQAHWYPADYAMLDPEET